MAQPARTTEAMAGQEAPRSEPGPRLSTIVTTAANAANASTSPHGILDTIDPW